VDPERIRYLEKRNDLYIDLKKKYKALDEVPKMRPLSYFNTNNPGYVILVSRIANEIGSDNKTPFIIALVVHLILGKGFLPELIPSVSTIGRMNNAYSQLLRKALGAFLFQKKLFMFVDESKRFRNKLSMLSVKAGCWDPETWAPVTKTISMFPVQKSNAVGLAAAVLKAVDSIPGLSGKSQINGLMSDGCNLVAGENNSLVTNLDKLVETAYFLFYYCLLHAIHLARVNGEKAALGLGGSMEKIHPDQLVFQVQYVHREFWPIIEPIYRHLIRYKKGSLLSLNRNERILKLFTEAYSYLEKCDDIRSKIQARASKLEADGVDIEDLDAEAGLDSLHDEFAKDRELTHLDTGKVSSFSTTRWTSSHKSYEELTANDDVHCVVFTILGNIIPTTSKVARNITKEVVSYCQSPSTIAYLKLQLDIDDLVYMDEMKWLLQRCPQFNFPPEYKSHLVYEWYRKFRNRFQKLKDDVVTSIKSNDTDWIRFFPRSKAYLETLTVEEKVSSLDFMKLCVEPQLTASLASLDSSNSYILEGGAHVILALADFSIGHLVARFIIEFFREKNRLELEWPDLEPLPLPMSESDHLLRQRTLTALDQDASIVTSFLLDTPDECMGELLTIAEAPGNESLMLLFRGTGPVASTFRTYGFPTPTQNMPCERSYNICDNTHVYDHSNMDWRKITDKQLARENFELRARHENQVWDAEKGRMTPFRWTHETFKSELANVDSMIKVPFFHLPLDSFPYWSQ
jgi:hypothetical protein